MREGLRGVLVVVCVHENSSSQDVCLIDLKLDRTSGVGRVCFARSCLPGLPSPTTLTTSLTHHCFAHPSPPLSLTHTYFLHPRMHSLFSYHSSWSWPRVTSLQYLMSRLLLLCYDVHPLSLLILHSPRAYCTCIITHQS